MGPGSHHLRLTLEQIESHPSSCRDFYCRKSVRPKILYISNSIARHRYSTVACENYGDRGTAIAVGNGHFSCEGHSRCITYCSQTSGLEDPKAELDPVPRSRCKIEKGVRLGLLWEQSGSTAVEIDCRFQVAAVAIASNSSLGRQNLPVDSLS